MHISEILKMHRQSAQGIMGSENLRAAVDRNMARVEACEHSELFGYFRDDFDTKNRNDCDLL